MRKESRSAEVSDPPTAVNRHIETVASLEERALEKRSHGEHLGDVVASRLGSMKSAAIHAVFFLVWVVINVGWIPGVEPFDPFPFGFLTLVVALEAIFLSLFLLISQNRLTRQSDKRTHLDLQVNLLIEAEVTQTLRILQRICGKLGVDLSDDPELRELAANTDLRRLVDAVESQIPESGGSPAAPNPSQEPKAPAVGGRHS